MSTSSSAPRSARRASRLVAAAISVAAALSLAAGPASAVDRRSSVVTPRAATSGPDGPGSRTAEELTRFQAAHGLVATGRADAATNQQLQSASSAELRRIYPAARSSYTLTGAQCTNARTVIGVGKGHGIPRRGMEIALMTAMQESKFVNDTTAVDHDSLGIFQQRPSTGWGTPAQITDVVLSTQSFYGVAAFGNNAGLLQIPSWQHRDRGEVAQAVQVSAYPDAYDQWTDWAVRFYDAQASSVRAITGDTGTAGPCAGTSPGRYYVDTFADAPVYASPTSTSPTGTLDKGTSYVFCKAYGRKISSGSSYNHYWLRTDPDHGPSNQWVSAFYLSRWGNDQAKDNNGTVITDC